MSKQPQLTDHDLSDPKTPFEYLRLYLSGFAMGSADIVPGVSGGTMAFILGVYTTLIDAIKSFNLDVIRSALQFDVQAVLDKVPFRFLIALGLGVLSAVFLLASLLHTLLDEQPTFLFAFFAGLIVASILAIAVKVNWSPQAMGALLLAAMFAFVLVGFSIQQSPVEDFKIAVEADEPDEVAIEEARVALLDTLAEVEFDGAEAKVDEFEAAILAHEGVEGIEDELVEATYEPSSPLVLFLSGSIAICAMILPGISGSFILLILGQYAVVLGAVTTRDIASIVFVGAGAAVGIILFSRVISWLLKHHENVTVAALVGFMAGSLRLIWTEAEKGVSTVSDTGQLDGGQVVLVILLILGGFLLVSFLDHLQSRANPVFAWFWKPAPTVDDIAEKAEALD